MSRTPPHDTEPVGSVYCPTSHHTRDGRPHTVIGCGATLPDIRDDDGLIDCPQCGIFFDPTTEPTEPTDRTPPMTTPSEPTSSPTTVWVLEMQQPDDECRVIGVYDTERAATNRLAGELTELWPTYISEDMDRFPWQTMFADHAAWCDEVIDRFTDADTGVDWRIAAHPVNPATPTCGSW